MRIETAEAIIAACRQAEYIYEVDVPESPEERIELAEHCVLECGRLREQGVRADAIEETLRLAELDASGPGRVDAEPVSEDAQIDVSSQQESVPEKPPAGRTPQEADSADRSSQVEPSAPVAAVSTVSEPVVKENLPIPAEIEGEPTPMPRDITGIDPVQIRRLHGENGAFLARVTYLLSLASADLRNAEHLRDAAYRVQLIAAKVAAKEAEEKITNSEAEAIAGLHADVVEWDARVRHHQDQVDQLRALKEIYKGNVDRLSREASMRHDEWLRSGGGKG